MAQIVNKNEILEIDSVASCNDYLGVPTLYEHVNVVDLSRLERVHSQKKSSACMPLCATGRITTKMAAVYASTRLATWACSTQVVTTTLWAGR